MHLDVSATQEPPLALDREARPRWMVRYVLTLTPADHEALTRRQLWGRRLGAVPGVCDGVMVSRLEQGPVGVFLTTDEEGERDAVAHRLRADAEALARELAGP